MADHILRRIFLVVLLSLLLAARPALGSDALAVRWMPRVVRQSDVAVLFVNGTADARIIEGSLDGRPLMFFPYGSGHAAVVGIDLETKPGVHRWRVAVVEPDREPRTAQGRLSVERRAFPVQRLTLPRGMVDLDPETERRAVAEGDHLRTLYRTITPERLWKGRFTRPVAGPEPPTGFGARRVINGQPRSPHAGADYAAPRGTPVVAANSGRVALITEYFFPGRLIVVDHGLGLYTLYFHLDQIRVAGDERVDRGQPIGTVGATGRATGPHLHFGVQLGAARVDPAALLRLAVSD